MVPECIFEILSIEIIFMVLTFCIVCNFTRDLFRYRMMPVIILICVIIPVIALPVIFISFIGIIALWHIHIWNLSPEVYDIPYNENSYGQDYDKDRDDECYY